MKTKLLLSGFLFVALNSQAQEPTVLNSDLSPINHNSDTSTVCTCAFWINKDLGGQGETSDWTKGGVDYDGVKFDNNESDVMYQEIAVLANTDYKLSYHSRVSNPADDAASTSEIEFRILKGSGYVADYTPAYQTDATLLSTTGWGYQDITAVEAAANNIATQKVSYPGDDAMYKGELTFNSGSETSIVIFARGIGGNGGSTDQGTWNWSAGNEETRLDYVTLTNQSALSISEVFSYKFKISPNPAKSLVSIITDEIVESIELYDIIGKKISINVDLSAKIINVSSLASGVYLVKVNSGNSVAIKRLIKE